MKPVKLRNAVIAVLAIAALLCMGTVVFARGIGALVASALVAALEFVFGLVGGLFGAF